MSADPLREAAQTMKSVRERCVWTQQITHRDLVPYLIEESHELIDAVEDGTRADLREELGDLLWQVLFHAAIAAQDPDDPFDIDDVARTLTEKMVRRHPHVFGDAIARTPEEVLVHWNAAKAAEKRERTSVLDGVSRGMPSLALAQKLLGRASALLVAAPVVADPHPEVAEPVVAEPHPEVAEPHPEVAQPHPEVADPQPEVAESQPVVAELVEASEHLVALPTSESELGDALLALVGQASANGWDAERALRERLRVLEAQIRAAEASR